MGLPFSSVPHSCWLQQPAVQVKGSGSASPQCPPCPLPPRKELLLLRGIRQRRWPRAADYALGLPWSLFLAQRYAPGGEEAGVEAESPMSPLPCAQESLSSCRLEACVLLGVIRPYCGWQEGSAFHTPRNGIRQRDRKGFRVHASLPTHLQVDDGNQLGEISADFLSIQQPGWHSPRAPRGMAVLGTRHLLSTNCLTLSEVLNFSVARDACLEK